MASRRYSGDSSSQMGDSESLPFLEKQIGVQLVSARTSSRAGRIIRLVLLTAVLSFGFILGTVVSSIRNPAVQEQHSTYSHSLVSPVPDLPIVSKEFQYQPLYALAPTEESEKAWQDLMPKGRGFVDLPSASGEEDEILAVSVFHQLHCLYIVREGYYALASGNGTSHSPSHHHRSAAEDGEDGEIHMMHCFDYLRQVLQCASDATLEPVNHLVTNGWGAVHVCRDYDALYDWAETNSKSSATGIGKGHVDR